MEGIFVGKNLKILHKLFNGYLFCIYFCSHPYNDDDLKLVFLC